MLYDCNTQKIKISLSELVAVARRGISPTLPFDEDEPRSGIIPQKRAEAIIGEGEPRSIRYGFETGGYSFELYATADRVDGDTVTLLRLVSSAEKPKKQEISEIRGEAFIIAHALAESEGYEKIRLRLVLVGETDGRVEESAETVDCGRLASFFERCLTAVSKYARPEAERVTERLPSLKSLKFPYPERREGQDEFIKSAYRALSRGGVLYASAPTGTGKTVSALFPAVRALGDGRYQKIFYLTPKSTTQEALRDCLSLMTRSGAKIKAVIMTAKEKACPHKTVCRRSAADCKCSRNNGLSDAALELYDLGVAVVDSAIAGEVAAKHGVCPYELLLTYAEICDLVCCDFNHVFDTRAYIRRFFDEGGSYALLVDEAHNLVERAREIYSSELSERDFAKMRDNPLFGSESAVIRLLTDGARAFREAVFPIVKDEIRESADGEPVGAASSSSIPEKLYILLDELCDSVWREINKNRGARDSEAESRISAIKSCYYKLDSFRRALWRFDDCYEIFVFYENGDIRVKIFCLDPSREIRARLDKCHGTVMFSATLSPLEYYKSVLGGERADDTLAVDSPFDPSQLSVTIMDKVSTRYSEREDTLMAVCRVIAATVSAKRGHYMIFSPSFAYSDALAEAFKKCYPKINIISQKKDMSEAQRQQFLDCFKEEDGRYLVAFCVMGGIYSEGIDLAGDSLIGAVIVGIGIPQLSYEREALAAYYNDKYDKGKEFAYVYPGMNRVFQAAGRVIRREDDRGVIVLIDDRFDDPIYKKSLPSLWKGVRFIGDAKRLREILDEFWSDK